MNKNILWGIVAFGGLILLGSIVLNKHDTTESQSVPSTQQAEEATLSQEVLAQIPVHPYIAVQNVRESSKDGVQFLSFMITVEGTKAEVNQWYRDALQSDGWTVTSDKNVAGYQIIQGENNNLFTSMQAASGSQAGAMTVSQQVQFR